MLTRDKYEIPLLKFAESLESGESLDFGSFDISRVGDTFEISIGNQVVRYTLDELKSYLKEEGILINGTVAFNVPTLTIRIKALPLESQRRLMNKALKVIIDNKMAFNITSEDGSILNGFIRDVDNSGKFKWFDNNDNYSSLELKFVGLDTLQVLSEGKVLLESTDCYIEVCNIAYKAI